MEPVASQINTAIVDLELRQLRLSAGEPSPLGARAFDLLIALVERRDRVVAKSELLDAVWPGLIVEENNLATQISALRKVMGADAITTIPGRGYRLTANVSVIGLTPKVELPRDDTGPSLNKCSTSARPLPAPPHLIGRDHSVTDVTRLLTTHRLVSLLGAGGMGKTALALALAHATAPESVASARPLDAIQDAEDPKNVHDSPLADPVAARWLSLAPLATAEALSASILGLWRPHEELTHLSQRPPSDLVASLPTPPTGLLILDNAEHLLHPVAQWVDALLHHAPDLRILVTSQAPLRLAAEQRYQLGPLPCPSPTASPEDLAASSALQLLHQAAEQHTGRVAWDTTTTALAAQICRALEGHPLALKLAAARLPLLGWRGLAGALENALDERLNLLATPPSSDTAARHQSLATALDWSFNLLDPAAQQALARLALSPAPCSLPLAGWLCASTLPANDSPALPPPQAIERLAELVDRSFADVQPGKLPCYAIPETTRLYLLARTASFEQRAAARRHHTAAVMHRLREADAAYWQSPDAQWLSLYSPELGALRAALAQAPEDDPTMPARLLGRSSFLFLQTGAAHEARTRWIAAAQPLLTLSAEAGAPTRPDPDLAHFHLTGARLHWGIDTPRMLALADQALQQFRTLADSQGQYLALRCSVGSGRHTESEATQLLADMKRLEDPRWPPRLRAQYLLAQIDHLAQAGADDVPTLKKLRTTRETLKRLSLDAGLETLAVLARIGLADSALLDNAPNIAIQRCRNLLADAPLYGNQRLQLLATLAAAQFSETATADARATLHDFATLCSRRDWEWFDRYADLFTLLAAQEGQAALARELSDYADQAAETAGGRTGPSWQRLHARVQQALATLPPAEPIAEPPCRPIEICRELKLGALDGQGSNSPTSA